MSELQMKKDITRLKNLLRDYRDHIIQKRAEKYKWIHPVNHIEIVDDAIDTIRSGL